MIGKINSLNVPSFLLIISSSDSTPDFREFLYADFSMTGTSASVPPDFPGRVRVEEEDDI